MRVMRSDTVERCQAVGTLQLVGRTRAAGWIGFWTPTRDPMANYLDPRDPGDADHMTDEAEAIRTVGRALAQLPDDASRVRVLRRAAERFQLESELARAAADADGRVEEAPDMTLSLDGVADFFPAAKHDKHAQLPDSELLALDSLLLPAAYDPHAELDAVDPIEKAASIDDSIDRPEIDAPAVEKKPAEPAQQSGSTLHDFVHDLQRLANDLR